MAASNLTTGAKPSLAAASTHQRLWQWTIFWALALGLYVVLGWLDTRVLDGVSVWAKPAKFALSLVVLYATLAGVIERLSPAAREANAMQTTLHVLAAAALFEMAYITLQAARGVHSHFNLGTVWEMIAYQGMALAAGILVVAVGVIGWLVGKDKNAAMPVVVREGVRLGLIISTVLTMLTAFYLGGNGGHHVGVEPVGAALMPLFGWSGSVGDLRPAHFVALHAMQFIPLWALALAYWGKRLSPQAAKALLYVGAGVYSLVCLAVFAQAIMGLPLLRL